MGVPEPRCGCRRAVGEDGSFDHVLCCGVVQFAAGPDHTSSEPGRLAVHKSAITVHAPDARVGKPIYMRIKAT